MSRHVLCVVPITGSISNRKSLPQHLGGMNDQHIKYVKITSGSDKCYSSLCTSSSFLSRLGISGLDLISISWRAARKGSDTNIVMCESMVPTLEK